jgi:rhomboid protease GluP
MADITQADGTVDYSHYTEIQIFQVLRRIDAEKYPLNFANLKARLAAQGIPIDDSLNAAEALMAAERVVFSRPDAPPSPEYRIAFAPRPGFLSWLGPSRNDFRLVGVGSIVVRGENMTVKGRRFGFILGLPITRRVELSKAQIVNVELEENVVRFETRTAEDKSKSLTFWLVDIAAAENLVQRLPIDKTPDFVPQLGAYLDFEEQLERRAPRLPITYGFALLCLLMFAITIADGAMWFKSNGVVQIGWGSNFGPATIGGQWWRLLTHSLLHFGVIHLAFNLWALSSFGAIAERLYGSARYAAICLVAGVAGGMTSIALQPNINSAGASAIVFGILGALLVSHLRGAEAIPPSVQKSLRNSTLFFALVALASGFIISGIDNAAHVGGLIAGTCMGLAFQSPRRVVRILAPAVLAVLVILTGTGLARRATNVPVAEAKYWESMRWFLSREADVVQNWIALQELARGQKVSDDALADGIEKDVLPFWREASGRFKRIEFDAGSEVFDSHQYMSALSTGRLHAVELCVSGLRKHDSEIVGVCMKEMAQVDAMIYARQKKLEDAR